MSTLDFPMKAEFTGEYCPECRAQVPHEKHHDVTVPEDGLPPVGQYAPEHEPQHHGP